MGICIKKKHFKILMRQPIKQIIQFYKENSNKIEARRVYDKRKRDRI